MVYSLIALVFVLIIAYVWLIRGFFSAFLHLLCVVIAGAIAFAAWEPLAYAILGSAGQGGTLEGIAWAVSLAVPFAVSLALLRVAVDKLLPANVNLPAPLNYAGGGLCGLFSGVITSGILMLSIGFLRLDSELWMAKPINYHGQGSVVKDGGVFVPTDKVVARLYGHLSRAGFRSGSALADYYPDLEDVPHSMRLNFGEGKARNTLRPGDFKFDPQGRYTVTAKTARELLNDTLPGPDGKLQVEQNYVYANGANVMDGDRIEGIVLAFDAGAKEMPEGKFNVGPGQIRLLVKRTAGPVAGDNREFPEVMSIYPMAVIAQASSDKPMAWRFRFDAPETFIATPGNPASSPFAFEFPVPANYEPVALYAKGIRVEVPATKPPQNRQFSSAAARDGAMRSGALVRIGGAAVGGGSTVAGGNTTTTSNEPADDRDANRIGDGRMWATGQFPEGVLVQNRLPGNMVLQKGTTGPGLELDDDNIIINGETTLTPEMTNRQGIEGTLMINQFAVTSDTVIVMVHVGASSKMSLLGRASAAAQRILPPQLVDTNGVIYEPVGFIYKDSTQVRIRFTPGEPIRALSQLPTLSPSRPDQDMHLVFRVSLGVTISRYQIGNKGVAIYNPPFRLDTPQVNRSNRR